MEPTTPAEHALLAAATADEECDLRTPRERTDLMWAPSVEAANDWNDDRIIRGEYLRHLLLEQQLPVHLIGARIDGDLNLSGTVTLSLPQCVLTTTAWFEGAKFAEAARFVRTTFTGTAWFKGVQFTGDTSFVGVTFTQIAMFAGATFAESAMFGRSTFTKVAWFEGVSFAENAWFDRTTFTGNAVFERATFTGDARFERATFIGNAGLDASTFTGDARFECATFTGDAWFRGATFTADARFDSTRFAGAALFESTSFAREAWFGGSRFTGYAGFDGARFTGPVWFEGAAAIGAARFAGVEFAGLTQFDGSRWHTIDWATTTWKTPSVVTTGLAAVAIVLDGAVFEQSVRLELTARIVSLKRTRAIERLHLVVAGADVDLEDADLAAGSLIDAAPVAVPAGVKERVLSGSWVPIPALLNEHGRIDVPAGMLLHEWLGQLLALLRLDRDLGAALNHTPQASVTSLRRAHVPGTTLSGMHLRACTFTGADGLDKLVIAGDDILTNHRGDKDMMRAWPARGRKWWRTSRRVLHDELRLRGPHPTTTPEVADTTTTTTDESGATPTAPLSHRSVSATYRSLRKALEDSKDEPGAADFYYGEMEMRRLASTPISVERWLLTAYWLIAGYGLRAWRSLATLLIVIAVAGWCFSNDAWAAKTVTKAPTSVNLDTGAITSTAPAADRLSLMRSWLFAAQETVALFRPAGLSGVTLTSWGHLIDIAVRILGPVLLALAALAIRNRTKR